MSHVNQVILIGNLGKDPDVLKSTEQGDFVRLSLATSKRYTDKNGEKHTDTQWHIVYLSNRLGKIGSCYLKKGDKVFVSGELRTRERFDDHGGRHFNTAIYARELKFLSVKSQDDSNVKTDPVQLDGPYTKAMQDIRGVLGEHLLINN